MTHFRMTLNGQCLISLILLLINLNEANALNKPPTLIRSIDLSTINENTPVNSYVFQLVAHDPENTPVSFEIHGTDLLKVDRRTGIVSVAKSIDRERTGEQIFFDIILTDQVSTNTPISNGQADEANVVNVPVKVYVIDENDNLPIWHVSSSNSLFFSFFFLKFICYAMLSIIFNTHTYLLNTMEILFLFV